MKRTIAAILAFTICALLLASCSSASNKEITETTTVLYVENAGFIAELGGHICYVEHSNADAIVTVADTIELTYMQKDHVVVINDEKLGGYQWDTVLIKASKIVVK